ncbi:MAG TPA: M56 family metallopeptidase [Gemmatimonadaceae bacterium]|nr:M56 family metallopeptidase [Gemmatimonadaceae bacterium]
MSDGSVRDALLHIADLVISLGIVKASVLAGLAVLLGHIGRRQAASVRAAVWGAAVLGLAALPLLAYAVPWWDLGLVAFPRGLFTSDLSLGRAAGVEPFAGAGPRLPPALGLAIVWAVGALVVAIKFLRQHLGIQLVAAAGDPTRDRRTLDATARLRASMGITRPVRVVFSGIARGPCAFGLRRPTVVLPHSAHGWSAERLDAVLRHELAHVTRWDYALLLAGELVRALYWFNPAIWLSLAALRRAQDAACDDLVLRSGMPATTYAGHLLGIAKSLGAGASTWRAALPLLHRSTLCDRIGAVLDDACDRRPLGGSRLLWGGVIAAATAVALSSANPWICETSSTATTVSSASSRDQ